MTSPEKFSSFEQLESSGKENEIREQERSQLKSFENGAFWFLALQAKEKFDQIAQEKGRISPEDQKEVFEKVSSQLQEITQRKYEDFEKKYGTPPRSSPFNSELELKRLIPLISLKGETYLDFGGPTGKIKTPSRETYLETMQNYLKKTENDPNTFSLVQSHLEGFSEAALKNGEIDTATRGVIIAGLIEKPEVRERIENIIEKMSNSDNEEERKRAGRAKEYLASYFEKK